MKLVAVILAGGEGRRIGGNKPLRLLAGKTLLNRAIASARRWSQVVAVAVRDDSQAGDCAVECLRDEAGVGGPLAGLIAALRFGRASGAESVLTIPSDMPFLPEDLADRLCGEIGGAAAAIAASGGHLHPVCGLWRTDVLESVPTYLGSGRTSLRGLAETVGFTEVDWPIERTDPFFNINSADDLLAAERLLES